MMSSCDPTNTLSQACCDALDAADSQSELADAWEVCDPSADVDVYTDPFTGKDCVDATCSGVVSCGKVKKACDYIGGNWTCNSGPGPCTDGKCKKCYD